ncbi:hypothetical protein [Peredibacter starrii]|uniref:Uncharacterized protein n=1 Tax=Peredibacter starrii TaxID=28202 RepID=A0AAX4HVF4_9BACT|nr:hypothetical protein [Peredibacter starrii]WPU67068.1 hypothetical protein SOO65_09915 [Peredibacter starrii]
MRILVYVLGLYMMSEAYGEDQKVIYQYKKYEKFDLGNLEVKGQLIAPGDISVRERERKRFELDLYTRKDFDGFIKKDIESLR